MTRDEEIEARDFEIEALAMHWLRQDEPPMSRHEAQARFDTLAECAAWSIEARDRYRAARQPAPETPTPTLRIEVLKRWLECCFELKCDAMVLGPGDDDHYLASPTGQRYTDGPDVTADELGALRQHAATLKERKEKADG